MKPPVTLDQLIDAWRIDSQIDDTEPGKELLKISSLQSKYLTVLSHHKMLVNRCNDSYAKMKRLKWEYYMGDLNNADDLEKHNLKPLYRKILRADIPTYLDSDTDLTNILIKKMVNQEIVDFCTAVLKEIHSRTFQLRSYIDWQKFIGGG